MTHIETADNETAGSHGDLFLYVHSVYTKLIVHTTEKLAAVLQ